MLNMWRWAGKSYENYKTDKYSLENHHNFLLAGGEMQDNVHYRYVYLYSCNTAHGNPYTTLG